MAVDCFGDWSENATRSLERYILNLLSSWIQARRTGERAEDPLKQPFEDFVLEYSPQPLGKCLCQRKMDAREDISYEVRRELFVFIQAFHPN